MSLHGDLGSHDECGTVLNWQNGYSDFYAETNKLCKAAGNQNLNSEPLLSQRPYWKQHFLQTTNPVQTLMILGHLYNV